MQFIAIDAPGLLAHSGHSMRAVARRIACGQRSPDAALVARAREAGCGEASPGRIESAGKWADARARTQLAEALGQPLGHALRPTFEWYICRGAFFHTDAHYTDVMFGVWYLDGPPVDIVFARAGVRVAALAGSIVVFDPFEVHGVLHGGASEYVAADYANAPRSVFAGFELELDDAVHASFAITEAASGARVVSTHTRVSAASGALD